MDYLTTTFNSINNYFQNNNIRQIIKNDIIKTHITMIDLIIVLISFYGLLYAPQVSAILTCQQVKIIESHKIYQYIYAFCLFYFVILLVNKTEIDVPPIQKFFNCVIYFCIFLIINRLNFTIMVSVLGLLFLVYFIYMNKQYYYKLNSNSNTKSLLNNQTTSSIQQNANIIPDHQYWITWDSPRIRLFPVEPFQNFYLSLLNKFVILLLLILIIIGFINYIGILKYTFKNKITLYNLFIDDPTCKPLNYALSFTDYLLLAFNYNYYINKVKPVHPYKKS